MAIEYKEKVDECKEKIIFSYDSDKVKDVIDSVAIDFGKNYKIKGFRKGKAPVDAIKQQAKKHVMDIAKRKLLSESYEDILSETKWKPFGQPEINEINFNSKNFNVEMILGHVPNFELSQYKDFEIEEPSTSIDPNDFKNKMNEQLCQELGDLKELDEDDFVLLGDEVCIDYIATIDGKPFKNSEGKDVKFVVGYGKALKELEDDIIGMSVGEEREITINFPEDFSQEDVKGKEAIFSVILKSAKRKEASEFSEEVVKKAGFKDMDNYNKVIDMKVNEKIEEMNFLYYRNKISEKIVEENKIEIPEWMTIEIAKSYSKMQGKDFDKLEEDERKTFIDDANKRLNLSFVLDKIKDKEIETNMSDEEIIGTINSNMHRFPPEVRNQLSKGNNPHLISQVASEIQDEYLMRWLINQSVKKKEKDEEKEGK
jgi:trigger factor